MANVGNLTVNIIAKSNISQVAAKDVQALKKLETQASKVSGDIGPSRGFQPPGNLGGPIRRGGRGFSRPVQRPNFFWNLGRFAPHSSIRHGLASRLGGSEFSLASRALSAAGVSAGAAATAMGALGVAALGLRHIFVQLKEGAKVPSTGGGANPFTAALGGFARGFASNFSIRGSNLDRFINRGAHQARRDEARRLRLLSQMQERERRHQAAREGFNQFRRDLPGLIEQTGLPGLGRGIRGAVGNLPGLGGVVSPLFDQARIRQTEQSRIRAMQFALSRLGGAREPFAPVSLSRASGFARVASLRNRGEADRERNNFLRQIWEAQDKLSNAAVPFFELVKQAIAQFNRGQGGEDIVP